ncbi:potassium-transporting ATPase subunit KdpA [Burkholderia ubonensis]|nr:potassium-transporting ATPase subunit KdpA [Burkholderia ubonensis]PAK11527.1 potassium-transporting ATPase subunit KdpA [Burkholderia ubonensis]RQP33618.1 potassium-transporting ATPase subunit KdpA [Burkholderia ubonensis]RQP36387.1 potassium-transporting ATPase subunit KdpA [Burkholderia ubonensis]RQP37937.1 potassium-transporting ATPase subunit KdpA [Burkholderia ubonensis]RQP51133.1 potassium-transporting ATPase subunit KdpA [Burkholderia ubonensis]
MIGNAWTQVGVFLFVLTFLVKPLGTTIARIALGDLPGPLRRVAVVERAIYRLAGVAPDEEMDWKRYAVALVAFNALGAAALYLLQRIQVWLPLNPQHLPNVEPGLAFNTAVSFATNTSWQAYAGETTLSHLTQMLGIGVQAFLSAASGMVVMLALIRGLVRRGSKTIGNVWIDLTRMTLYVLVPLAALFAAAFIGQGVVQNFAPNRDVAIVQPHSSTPAAAPTLPMGPVASQESIKLMSGDGGGFFNANSAHPYENPTPFANFLQMLAMLIIPAALCHTFGTMIQDRRQGWAIYAAMLTLFVAAAAMVIRAEQAAGPALSAPGIDTVASASQPGGNMEGKETRFGIVSSALYATVSTSSGDGAVDAMHDSFTPLGGLVPMALMQTGEVVFGGPGSGLYSMLMVVLLAVFVAGLMIGRAPEYVGKKIEAYEMKMVSIAILATPAIVLVGTAIAAVTPAGVAGLGNPGAHGFSEMLYAFSSAANNNGSAFAGLAANTTFYNTSLAAAMWFGRFMVIVPVLAIAGSLAAKQRRAAGAGTLPTHGPLFVCMLLSTVVLVTLLTFLPALALGPIAEHLAMTAGR